MLVGEFAEELDAEEMEHGEGRVSDEEEVEKRGEQDASKKEKGEKSRRTSVPTSSTNRTRPATDDSRMVRCRIDTCCLSNHPHNKHKGNNQLSPLLFSLSLRVPQKLTIALLLPILHSGLPHLLHLPPSLLLIHPIRHPPSLLVRDQTCMDHSSVVEDGP